MWSDYNSNSENLEKISSQSGFFSLPHFFPCALGGNKYFPMFPKVFGCLEHTSNCFIFSISRPKWPERNKINLYSWISSRCSGEKAVPQTKRTPERRFAKEANVGGGSSRAFCTRWAGIDFIAIVSIEKQTCINLDKEIGEYVVDIIYGGARKGHRIFLFKTQVLFFKTHVIFFFQNPGFFSAQKPPSFF